MTDNEILVSLPGGSRVEALWKGFVIPTDQPVRSGGGNTAPSPFDLFLASLATCAGYYVLAFCQERKIPTEGITLVQRMEKGPKSKLIEMVQHRDPASRRLPGQVQGRRDQGGRSMRGQGPHGLPARLRDHLPHRRGLSRPARTRAEGGIDRAGPPR